MKSFIMLKKKNAQLVILNAVKDLDLQRVEVKRSFASLRMTIMLSF